MVVYALLGLEEGRHFGDFVERLVVGGHELRLKGFPSGLEKAGVALKALILKRELLAEVGRLGPERDGEREWLFFLFGGVLFLFREGQDVFHSGVGLDDDLVLELSEGVADGGDLVLELVVQGEEEGAQVFFEDGC